MTLEIALVLGILLVAVVLFVSEWLRVDVVALGVLVALALTGLVTPNQAVSGFSSPAVITIWAVFILTGGLSRTGVAGILGRQVLRLAGSGELRLVMLILLTGSALSAFMNNVGVTALLLPVVMDIARRTGHSPSKLLIPLAYSSLLGGLTTLIGTPPNLLVSAALEEGGFAPFTLFEFAPVGIGLVLAGTLYMSLVGRRLLPERDPGAGFVPAGGEEDLEEAYGLHDRLFTLDVPPNSPLAGQTLAESRLGGGLGVQVMAVVHHGELELAPEPERRLVPGDRIVVQGSREALDYLGAREYLALESAQVELEALVSDDVAFAEVKLAPDSSLLGKTLREIDFRHRFHGCLVLSVWRDGEPLRTHLANTELIEGDVLLVHGRRDQLDRMVESSDFEVSPIFDPLVYDLEERLMSCVVPHGSPLAGKTLGGSRLGDVFSLGVMAIEREGAKILIPPPAERLQEGDRLIVKGRLEDLSTAGSLHEMPAGRQAAPKPEELESERVALAEIVVAPRSGAAGKTLAEMHFREKYGMNVVAVQRGGTTHRDLRYLRLQFGDALLVHGPREKLRLLAREPDFLTLTERDQPPPLTRKAPISGLLMLGVVVSVILGWVPIHIAAVTGALLMVVTGCLSMDEAYRSIEWQAVFMIAGMLPLGVALQDSGAAALVAREIVGSIAGLGPLAVVAAFFILTALCAQVIPTAAVAILIAPLALSAAADLGLSPRALLMTVAMSASVSFMSPVSHPSNILIMGPGGYRFTDYTRVGFPLTVVCLVVTLILLPFFFPLTPS